MAINIQAKLDNSDKEIYLTVKNRLEGSLKEKLTDGFVVRYILRNMTGIKELEVGSIELKGKEFVS